MIVLPIITRASCGRPESKSVVRSSFSFFSSLFSTNLISGVFAQALTMNLSNPVKTCLRVPFLLVRQSFVMFFFYLDQTVLNEMRRCTMFFYSKEIASKIRQHHTLHIHFIQVCLEIKQSLCSSRHKRLHVILVRAIDQPNSPTRIIREGRKNQTY